jgi:hypothetical protein
MRSHHVIATAVVLVMGFVVKTLFFSSPPTEAQLHSSSSMNPFQQHVEYPDVKSLPEQSIKEPF